MMFESKSIFKLAKVYQSSGMGLSFHKQLQTRELPKNSKLLGLKPRLDEEGHIRSEGRLRYAEFLSEDAQFPIILPRKNQETKLIVKHYHYHYE